MVQNMCIKFSSWNFVFWPFLHILCDILAKKNHKLLPYSFFKGTILNFEWKFLFLKIENQNFHSFSVILNHGKRWKKILKKKKIKGTIQLFVKKSGKFRLFKTFFSFFCILPIIPVIIRKIGIFFFFLGVRISDPPPRIFFRNTWY